MSVADFAGHVVIVTGAASGIGLATCRTLVERGAVVAALDRVAAPAGDGVHPVVADVTDRESVANAVHAAARDLGRVDVLVNNAGIGAVGTVEENDDDEWHRVLDVNVVGVARTTAAALPYLRRSPAGAVVNTCSAVATVGLPRRAVYAASKGAVHALTMAMAADLVADRVRVNCVCPGTVDTPWVERLVASAEDPAAARRALAARQPLGRLAAPSEIADAIAHLASPRSGFLTGCAFAVDAGITTLRLPQSSPP